MTTQLDLIDALTEQDRALARVTEASDDQDVAVVDQAILAVANRGGEFTSYDVRPLLPEIRSMNLVGARFKWLAARGAIRYVRHERCRIPSSHGRTVAVWEKVV